MQEKQPTDGAILVVRYNKVTKKMDEKSVCLKKMFAHISHPLDGSEQYRFAHR